MYLRLLRWTYEWDKRKNQTNQTKHGFAFEDVELVFEGGIITFEDDRANYGEIRYVTLGILLGCCVVIVHTPRGKNSRIISVRKANEKERKIYQERLKKG